MINIWSTQVTDKAIDFLCNSWWSPWEKPWGSADDLSGADHERWREMQKHYLMINAYLQISKVQYVQQKKSGFHSFFKYLEDLNGTLKKFEFKFKPGLDWGRTETVWLSRGCPWGRIGRQGMQWLPPANVVIQVIYIPCSWQVFVFSILQSSHYVALIFRTCQLHTVLGFLQKRGGSERPAAWQGKLHWQGR